MQPPAGTTVGLGVDLQAGWIEQPDAATLRFTVQVQGPGTASTNSEQEWRFHFTIAGTAYVASAREKMANQQNTGLLADGSAAPGGVATGVTIAGDHLIVLTVPLSNIGNPTAGAIVTGTFVEAESFLVGQAKGWITDRAPNSGSGADYVMAASGGSTSTPVLPKTFRQNLTTPTVGILHGFVAKTNDTYLYNWTQGPASARIALVLVGSGKALVTVRDAAGTTLFTGNATRSLNVTAKAGVWTLRINYTAFKGNLTLGIEPRTGTTTATSSGSANTGPHASTNTQTGSPGSATGSSAGTSSKKGTPGLVAPLGLGALLVGAISARRRRRA